MPSLTEQLTPHAGGAETASKDGVSADFQRGVVLKGPWETWGDGFSEHTRRNARALALAGAPVGLRSTSPRIRIAMGEEESIDLEYGDLLRRTIGTVAAQVIQVVPNEGVLANLTSHRYYSVEESAFINGRMAVYAVWERMAGLREDDRIALNAVGQVWVSCNETKRFLAREGVDEGKLRVFGCPYLPTDPHLKLRGRAKNSPRPRFYHVGKWEPRKDQHRLIGAFLCAFKPGEAMLFVKTSDKAPFYQDYPHHISVCLQQWLEDERVRANGWTEKNVGRDLLVATRRLGADAMVSLHRVNDCYVTLSRGEGFDMPAFDAKLSGNLMIYTPSGGPQDFAHPEDICVPSSGLVDAHPFYRWVKGSKYLDWEFEAAVEAYRAAADKIRANVDATPDLSPFSAVSIGQGMARALRELGDLNLSEVP